jgi:predicted Zn-dependent protease
MGTVSGAMGQDPTLTQEVFMQAMGLGTQIGMLKFSRQHESEADRIGLIFMALAGYDPHEAPKFWTRMSGTGGGQQPPEWMSTHPSHETRISDLEAAIPEAMQYYKQN